VWKNWLRLGVVSRNLGEWRVAESLSRCWPFIRSLQVWSKKAFAGGVEVVHINQGNSLRHGLPQLGLVENESDDPEDLQFLIIMEGEGGGFRVCRQQGRDGPLAVNSPSRQASTVAMGLALRVPSLMPACTCYGHWLGHKRWCGVLYAELVQVDGLFDVGMCRAGKSAFDRRQRKRQFNAVWSWVWCGKQSNSLATVFLYYLLKHKIQVSYKRVTTV